MFFKNSLVIGSYIDCGKHPMLRNLHPQIVFLKVTFITVVADLHCKAESRELPKMIGFLLVPLKVTPKKRHGGEDMDKSLATG